MYPQDLNAPVMSVSEMQHLSAFLLHDMISYVTSISAGLDMRVETWGEVAPLMRQSRDALLAHVNLMRFIMTSQQAPSAQGWGYVHVYGLMAGVEIHRDTPTTTAWEAGLVFWAVKQCASKSEARVAITQQSLLVDGPGFMLDTANADVLLGRHPCGNPRQSFSRYLHLVASSLGYSLGLDQHNPHSWTLSWQETA